jgi:leucyl aminopeptidase
MLPTSTNVKLDVKCAIGNVDAVMTFITQSKDIAEQPLLADAERIALRRLIDNKAATGKAREVAFEILEVGNGKFRRVYAVGLGKPEKLTAESFRQAAGAAIRALRSHRIARAAFVVPGSFKAVPPAEAAEALAMGALLASFDYEEYKGTGKSEDDAEEKTGLELTIVSDEMAIGAAVTRGRLIADGQNFARTIASRPGNDINPPTLAKAAQSMAREVNLKCRVLDEKELAKLKMGGILAVGAGSIASPPRMIVLEYNGLSKQQTAKKSKAPGGPLLVVGKAVTFDTGGISIKPADRMGRMIYDKSGGTVVLGLMCALAKLKIPTHVVGILSSAENAISSKAYRPGDILRMYNGVTVEVTNTDAEGRLVLGDALAWGIETYKPSAVVDLATLTGGVVTALGTTMAGVMSNSDDLVASLISAGESAGEKIWRLPLGPDQRDQIKSHHADIVNSAGREAHPLQGGAFLSYFVPTDGSIPWAHLDIAGVADIDKELPYYSKGSTGWGVRTLIEWIRLRSE